MGFQIWICLALIVLTIFGVSGNPIPENATNETATTVDAASDCGGIVGFFHICPQNNTAADSASERKHGEGEASQDVATEPTNSDSCEDNDDVLILKREAGDISPEQESGVDDESNDSEDKMTIRDVADDKTKKQKRQVAYYDDGDDDDILELRKRDVSKDDEKSKPKIDRMRRDDDDDYSGSVENSDTADDDTDTDSSNDETNSDSSNNEDCDDNETRKKREAEKKTNETITKVKREDSVEPSELKMDDKKDVKNKRDAPPLGAAAPSDAKDSKAFQENSQDNDRKKRDETKKTATIKNPPKESVDKKVRRDVAEDDKMKRDAHSMGTKTLPAKAAINDDDSQESLEESKENDREKREETKKTATIKNPLKESVDKKVRRDVAEDDKMKRDVHSMGTKTLPAKAAINDDDSQESLEESKENDREKREETKKTATIKNPPKESIDKKVRRDVAEDDKMKRDVHSMGTKTLPAKAATDDDDSKESLEESKENDREKREDNRDNAAKKQTQKEGTEKRTRRDLIKEEKTKRDSLGAPTKVSKEEPKEESRNK